MTAVTHIKEHRLRSRVSMFAAPLAAMFYPFLLEGYSQSVRTITAEGVHASLTPWLLAAAFLLAAFATSGVALAFAMGFSLIATPTAAELRAKQAALLAVAAPPIFTFAGVVLYMLGDPVPDKWALVVLWALVVGAIARNSDEPAVAAPARPISPYVRAAHGVSALGVIAVFLLMHIGNHLAGLAGPDAHAAVMKTVRLVYRSTIVEPALVGLFLFQVASGLYLFWRSAATPSDHFRTFQLASGVYLSVFVLGHMNSVFVFARAYLGVDTGWGFATGAPAGLLKDPWNIRLAPHYAMGVFFALSHLAAGTRMVMLNHGMSKDLADRLLLASAAFSGVIAASITLGLCGLRLWGV
jgi:hypothetical protein